MISQIHEEDFTDYERQILSNIEHHGCHVTHVFDARDPSPDFTYSAGFTHSVDQGEVIVFGLPQEVMHAMVNMTMEQCDRDGLILRDGLRISGLLQGFDVVARAVAPRKIQREHFNSAMWHHVIRFGAPLTVAYHLVWPSSATGLFPWDEGCHEDVIALQPALYETRLNS